MTPDEKKALYELLDAIREERITDEQFAHLRQLMHHNAEAEELYVEYMIFCADLKKRLMSFPDDILRLPLEPDDKNEPSVVRDLQREEQPDWKTQQAQLDAKLRVDKIKQGAEKTLLEFNREEQRREEERLYREYLTRRRQCIAGITSFAALVAILLLAWLAPPPELELAGPIAKKIPVEQPLVAEIVKSRDAIWDHNDLSTDTGTRLRAVPLFLKQGLVQIELDDGAEVILQAPCEFELQSAGKMFLQSGAVCAKVPQRAHGFTVETLSSSVVDYGTEFGVLVAGERLDRQCEIHVFDGIVGVRSIKEQQFPLTYLKRGQAAIAKTTGKINIGRINDSARHFVQRLFDVDSGFVGWWRFEEDSGNVIKDSSGNGHDGMIVGGAKIVTDPVRGQVLRNVAGGSVDLHNVSNPIPNFDADSSITLAAWVKLEAASTGNYHYVIQLGQNDDYPIASLGLLPDGALHSYIESDQPGYNFDQVGVTGDVVESGVFARWHHIAIVHDRSNDIATTYVDGVAGPTADISLLNDDYAFTWTAAHLGANSANTVQYIGLMDDVAIFNQALTEIEIQAVMAGRVHTVE
jgi:hypothetical protein